jgi:hypothetical protein
MIDLSLYAVGCNFKHLMKERIMICQKYSPRRICKTIPPSSKVEKENFRMGEKIGLM